MKFPHTVSHYQHLLMAKLVKCKFLILFLKYYHSNTVRHCFLWPDTKHKRIFLKNQAISLRNFLRSKLCKKTSHMTLIIKIHLQFFPTFQSANSNFFPFALFCPRKKKDFKNRWLRSPYLHHFFNSWSKNSFQIAKTISFTILLFFHWKYLTLHGQFQKPSNLSVWMYLVTLVMNFCKVGGQNF